MTGADAVVEETVELAFVDEHRLLPWDAFVVVAQHAGVARECPIVDDADARVAYLFAELSGEDAVAGADEVGLEGMSDGFVQQDAAAAGCHHDGHLAAFYLRGREQEVRSPDGFADNFFDECVGKELPTHLQHTGGEAHLCLAATLHDDAHRERRAGAEVVEGRPVAGCELHLLHPLGDVGLDLNDRGVQGTGFRLDIKQELTDGQSPQSLSQPLSTRERRSFLLGENTIYSFPYKGEVGRGSGNWGCAY